MKTRWETIDQDYVSKLSDEEKTWLSNFMEEYNGANFNHPGKKLHRTKKGRRDCYNRNNARNRDMYTLMRTRGWVATSVEAIEEAQPPRSPEDAMAGIIDNNLMFLFEMQNDSDKTTKRKRSKR